MAEKPLAQALHRTDLKPSPIARASVRMGRIEAIEMSLALVLERERADNEESISAQVSLLLGSFAELRKQPAITRAVSDEMLRLASKLQELATIPVERLGAALADGRQRLRRTKDGR